MNDALRRLEIPEEVKEALRELLRELKKALGRDFKLYLFGSYARGDWVRGSDVDLIVVSPKFREVPKYSRTPMVRKLARKDLPFEILCYTPEELMKLLEESTFMREVANYWVELH